MQIFFFINTRFIISGQFISKLDFLYFFKKSYSMKTSFELCTLSFYFWFWFMSLSPNVSQVPMSLNPYVSQSLCLSFPMSLRSLCLSVPQSLSSSLPQPLSHSVCFRPVSTRPDSPLFFSTQIIPIIYSTLRRLFLGPAYQSPLFWNYFIPSWLNPIK
jgi:hypothetical protein